jgi:hypothetical protein
MRSSTLLVLAAVVAISACSLGAAPGATPTTTPPSGTPGVTPGPLPTPADRELSTAELKYRLIDAFAPLTYCDPDQYPIAHGDENEKATAQFPAIRSDAPTFSAIRDRLGIGADTTFGADQRLAIYREWKRLNAVVLTDAGGGRMGFDLVTETDPGMGQGTESKGTIDARGTIAIGTTAPAFLAGCPICLARGTLIETPEGLVPVERLAVGDPIWTADADGRRVAAVVLRTGRAPVPETHRVVRIVLDDGRTVFVSPGHPLGNGRHAGELRVGDRLDGATVRSADLVGYGAPFTYDVLPSGASGLYWANGILLASTLSR